VQESTCSPELEVIQWRQQLNWKAQHSRAVERERALKERIKDLEAKLREHEERLALEVIEWRQQANYWKTQHSRAVERERALKEENKDLRAKLRDWEERFKEFEAMKAELALYKRMLFGRSSEQRNPDEAPDESAKERDGAQDEPGESTEERDEVEDEQQGSEKRRRGKKRGEKGYGRKKREELPGEEIRHELPEEKRCCPDCGKPFEELPWTEDSEEIDLIFQLIRLIHKRSVYKPTCSCGAAPGIVTAAVPPKLIPKGLFTVDFWAWVILEKFLFQRPLFRVLLQLELWGLDDSQSISQGTLTGGLKRIGELVQPLYARFLERSRQAKHWHMDETRWMVFVEIEGKVGHRWWLWVVVTKETCSYILDPSRSAKVPKGHLAGAAGILSVDRYSAYKSLEEAIQLAFCWSHVRRDFDRVLTGYKELKGWSEAWIEGIGKLYKLNDERLEVRNDPEAFARRDQILREAVEHMAQERERELSEEGLHAAKKKVLTSMKNHWEGLLVFVDNPDVPMDNNVAERAVRNPVIGRKNYYGSGSVWSGYLAASLFTILQTVKRNGINPQKFLQVYLEACAKNGGKPPEDIDAFLPWSLSEEVRRALGLKEAPT
jgi:transposase